MKEIEQYIKKIVNHTDCTKDEKEDLAEELTVHLEILMEEYMKLGMSEKEAVQEAIRTFGSENTIGHQLQQAMFPYRREILITIALCFITLSFSAYSFYLMIEQDALYIELLINIFIGLGLLAVTVSNTFNTKRKLIINIMLALALIGSLMNSMIFPFSEQYHYILLFLTLFNYALILAIIVMLYVTTLNSSLLNQPLSTSRKLIHFVNITAGLILFGATLFFLWAVLFFSEWDWGYLKLFIPLAIWIGLYIIQVRFQVQLGKFIYIFFGMYALFIGAIIAFFFQP